MEDGHAERRCVGRDTGGHRPERPALPGASVRRRSWTLQANDGRHGEMPSMRALYVPCVQFTRGGYYVTRDRLPASGVGLELGEEAGI